uniref:Jerky protein-like n=1 Tax=Diabrotica virgifera virgifera TaxID=50390 RepID=A0A6P7FZZ9_DIAVI
MATKRKNVVVTMEKKLEALGRIDKGESLKTIAASYRVGTSTVSDWKKNRTKIEEFCFKMITKESLNNRCKANKAKNETLDEALCVWFYAERERGLPVSGPIIQESALKLNQMLPDCEPNFTASQSWLDRWRKRHGLRQLSIYKYTKVGSNDAEVLRFSVLGLLIVLTDVATAPKSELFV